MESQAEASSRRNPSSRVSASTSRTPAMTSRTCLSTSDELIVRHPDPVAGLEPRLVPPQAVQLLPGGRAFEEPEALVVVKGFHRLVLRRGEIAPAQLEAAAVLHEPLLDVIHDRRLDPPSHRPAAHQETVDRGHAADLLEQHDRDGPEVAEAVPRPRHPELAGRRGCEALDLGQRVALGGQVELVRLGKELVHARQVFAPGEMDLQLRAQAREIAPEIARGRLQLLTLTVLPVLAGLAPVLLQ